jgi:hypothetical protein
MNIYKSNKTFLNNSHKIEKGKLYALNKVEFNANIFFNYNLTCLETGKKIEIIYILNSLEYFDNDFSLLEEERDKLIDTLLKNEEDE